MLKQSCDTKLAHQLFQRHHKHLHQCLERSCQRFFALFLHSTHLIRFLLIQIWIIPKNIWCIPKSIRPWSNFDGLYRKYCEDLNWINRIRYLILYILYLMKTTKCSQVFKCVFTWKYKRWMNVGYEDLIWRYFYVELRLRRMYPSKHHFSLVAVFLLCPRKRRFKKTEIKSVANQTIDI